MVSTLITEREMVVHDIRQLIGPACGHIALWWIEKFLSNNATYQTLISNAFRFIVCNLQNSLARVPAAALKGSSTSLYLSGSHACGCLRCQHAEINVWRPLLLSINFASSGNLTEFGEIRSTTCLNLLRWEPPRSLAINHHHGHDTRWHHGRRHVRSGRQVALFAWWLE